jgi:hypothetical protein
MPLISTLLAAVAAQSNNNMQSVPVGAAANPFKGGIGPAWLRLEVLYGGVRRNSDTDRIFLLTRIFRIYARMVAVVGAGGALIS